MKIKELNINSFGGIKNKKITFEEGFNHLAHNNEFGKSSIIEAIKASVYGFSPVKNYPYLPLTVEKIDMVCTLDLADENDNIGILKIARVHSGERVQAKIVYEDSTKIDQKPKAIRNKSIYDALKEDHRLDLDELDAGNWMIDSDSIEEHKKFLKTIKQSTISFYESINYKGSSLDDIKQKIEYQKRQIYTNSSHSNSKIKKNEAQILKINKHLKELIELENIKQEDYAEYLATNEKKLMLEDEIHRLKQERVSLEKNKKFYMILSEYKKLKLEDEINGYQKIKDVPKLAELNKYKDKLAMIEDKISETQEMLNQIENNVFDDCVKNLVLLDKDTAIRELFAMSNQLEKVNKELASKKDSLQNSSLIDARNIDIEKANRELLLYSIEYSKMEQFNWLHQKAFFKHKESIYFSMLLLTVVLSYFNIYSGIGFVMLSFFVILFIKSKEKQERYITQKMIDINTDNYAELLKLNRGRSLVSSLKKPSEEMMELIAKDLTAIDDYQKTKMKYDEIRENFEDALINFHDITRIMQDSGYAIAELEALYIREQAKVLLSIKQQESLRIHISKLVAEKRNIENMIDKIEKTYINLWGFCDELRLEQLFENATLNQKQLSLMALEMETMAFSEEHEHLKDIDIEDELNKVTVELSDKEKSLTEIKETIARLEERLSKQDLMILPEYQSLSVDEIKNVREKLRRDNQELAKEYNILVLKEKIIERSFEILKSKLKPSYVKTAEQYLSIMAPDARVYIEYSTSSAIIFKDKISSETLDFSMLSTGTQAQIVLSLKIAYLDNLDPKRIYPIIIDDALMAYDDARKKGTIKLLQELSAKRQIIYFEAV